MKLVKGIVLAAVATASCVISAETPVQKAAPAPTKRTPAEIEAARYAATGGMLVKPGTPSGTVRVLNAQKELPLSEFKAAVKTMGAGIEKFDIIFEDVAAPADFAEAHAKSGSAVVVFLVADDKTPTLLAAPDDGWAVMNVRKLGATLKTPAAREKFFASRCRKQFMRTFAAAAGGIGSTYQENIMNVAKLPDLDLCAEFLPYDKSVVIAKHLTKLGLKPTQLVPYRKALMEGWAPSPTNDVQKKLWDKVHELPSNPIKIKYDPKRDK